MSGSTTLRGIDRSFGLDLVRAIAICIVLHTHSFSYFDTMTTRSNWQLPVPMDGVTLFFVLSGFLIGRILFTAMAQGRLHTPMDLLSFWERRWWRTLPGYFLMLGVLVFTFLVADQELPADLWQYVLFLQNIAWPHPGFFGEAWSLSVEEWFYVAMPVALIIVARSPERIRATLSLMMMAGFLLTPILLRHMMFDPAVPINYNKLVVYRFDTLMIGVAGAWLAVHVPGTWSRYAKPMLISGLAIVIGIKVHDVAFGHSAWFTKVALEPASALGALLCIPFLSAWNPDGAVRPRRVITWIATISYSMYLVNSSFVQWSVIPQLPGWLKGLPQETWLRSLIPLTVFWALSLLFAHVLYHGFEKRMTAMRDKVWWRRKPDP